MRKKRLGFILLLLLLAARAAEATSLAPAGEEDLTDQASIIVLAECTALETRWEGRSLYTLATLAVAESWKGEAGATLTVALPGGVDVNRPIPIDVRYPGAPRMAPGEQAVLFLTEEPAVPGAYSVVGFNAGLLPIAPPTTAPGGDAVVVPRSVGTERISVEALGERIRRRVAEEGGAR